MALQLAAILVSLFGGILLLFMNKWWDPVAERLGYPFEVDRHVKDLMDAIEALLELRSDILKLDPKPSNEQAKGWMRRVDAVQTEADKIKKRYDNNHLSLQRFFPYYFNRCSSSRLANRELKRAKELHGEGKTLLEGARTRPHPFRNVSQQVSMPPWIKGMESDMQKALDFIADYNPEASGMLGIWGMGGIGKTTLLKQLRDSYTETASFDHVLFIVASRECKATKIQKDVAISLGLREMSSVQSQATIIHNTLRDKSFLLLLDDLWERLDLEDVGIPLPLGVVGECRRKVILTTRSEAVCANMECRNNIKMECLNEDDAWNLFKYKTGEDIINLDSQIFRLARLVAEECEGLPLALITIGRAMSNKRTPDEWENALDLLKKSQLNQIPGTDKNVYSLLKFSYDNLESDTMRECFLLCSLWPEDYIYKDYLIHCWIGLGLIADFDDIGEAYRFGYSLIGGLHAACLLERGNSAFLDKYVKVHDVTRDMALWVASDCGKSEHKWLVRPGKELVEIPHDGMLWQTAERVSLMINDIELVTWSGAITAPNLTTLMLQENMFLPPDIFQAIQHFSQLTYLDLELTNIRSFPLQICELVELQYLNLSRNSIPSLPNELCNLKKLKNLYLRNNLCNYKLTIPRMLISELNELQILDLFNSELSVHTGHLDEILHGARLKSLGCCLRTLYDILRLEMLHGVRITSLRLNYLEGVDTLELSSGIVALQGSLRELSFYSCHDLKKVIVEGATAARLQSLNFDRLDNLESIIWTQAGRNVRRVNLFCCHSLRHATWVQHLPCLEELHIRVCDQLRRVITRADEIVEEEAEESILITLPRLTMLWLGGLPELDAFVDQGKIDGPALREVYFYACPKLRRMPIMARSNQDKIKVFCEREWWDRLEWASDAEKSCFHQIFDA